MKQSANCARVRFSISFPLTRSVRWRNIVETFLRNTFGFADLAHNWFSVTSSDSFRIEIQNNFFLSIKEFSWLKLGHDQRLMRVKVLVSLLLLLQPQLLSIYFLFGSPNTAIAARTHTRVRIYLVEPKWCKKRKEKNKFLMPLCLICKNWNRCVRRAIDLSVCIFRWLFSAQHKPFSYPDDWTTARGETANKYAWCEP